MSFAFKIQKNVPMSPHGNGKGDTVGLTDVLRKMRPGDSTWTPCGKQRLVSSSVSRMRKILGMKFATRRDGAGYRVWRIS